MRWQELVLKLHITPPSALGEEEVLAMVVEDAATSLASEQALRHKLATNPVYRAFEDVRDVEDLYRIAELWVNQPTGPALANQKQ